MTRFTGFVASVTRHVALCSRARILLATGKASVTRELVARVRTSIPLTRIRTRIRARVRTGVGARIWTRVRTGVALRVRAGITLARVRTSIGASTAPCVARLAVGNGTRVALCARTSVIATRTVTSAARGPVWQCLG